MNFIRKLTLSILPLLILSFLPTNAKGEVVNKILAYVGNKIITEYDVQSLDRDVYKKILTIKEEEHRNQQLKKYETEVLDYLISQMVVTIAAEREGIKVTEAEVDAAIAEIMKRNNIPEGKLEEALAADGMSLAKYRLQLRNDILSAKIRSQVLMPKIVVTEHDLREVADQKQSEYDIYEKYFVRILLTSDKQTLNKVLVEIQKGLSFDEAVKKYSIDPTAANGGKMGWIEAELMSDTMKDALLDGKKNALTKPFELNGQWGVFFIDDYKNKYIFDEETRKKLTEDAADKIFKHVFSSWLERNKNTIVIMKAGSRFEKK